MSLGKILLHEDFLDHLVLFSFVHSSYDIDKFIRRELLNRRLSLIGVFGGFSRSGFRPSCLQWAITPNMPLLFAVEAMPFLSEGDLFFFSQGNPGTGTSRGKIHGIQVFGKFLLPLLSGGFLPKGFLGLVLSSAENILPSLVFLMLVDGCFYPVTKMGESSDGFEIDHRSLESIGKSLEELLANHGFVYVVFPHSDYVFKVRDVFINIASFHFEGEDVPPCKILAHVVLECFGKVVDDRHPDPFICVSSPKGYVFGDQLTCVLYPCFDSGSSNISQK